MCNCLQRHISKLLPLLLSEKPHFQQKANLCICSSKVTGYSIMLISSGNIFGSTINPWRLLKCFLFCSSVVHICTHTHKHTYAHFPNSLSQHQKSGAILQFITSLSSFLSLFFYFTSLPWWPLGTRVPVLLWPLWEWRSMQRKNWKLWLSFWLHRKSLYHT